MANGKPMANAIANAMANRWQTDGIGRVIGMGMFFLSCVSAQIPSSVTRARARWAVVAGLGIGA